jgi:acetyl esterase
MGIDEATRAFLAALPDGTPLTEMTPAEARAMQAALADLYGPGPALASVGDHEIRVADGEHIRVRSMIPDGSVNGLVVYLHGGGWVMGGIDEIDTLARELATRSHAALLLVEYRLAPEYRYPVALDDAWAALRWGADHVEELVGRRVPLIVAGDSAGGNLAAAVAQRAATAGIDLALQVLVYPVLGADFDTPTYLDPQNELVLTRAGMQWFWDHYAPREVRDEPGASPIAAADLSGLAPAAIVLAEHDVLRHEGEQYAAALARAGVPVDLRVFDGQMHLFFTLVNVLPASAPAIDHVADRIDQAIVSTRRAEGVPR